MRRIWPLPLTILLLLSGCAGSKESEQFARWQEKLTSAREISFTGEITGTWDEGAAAYTAQFRRAGERTDVTVTAPDTISGVTFSYTGGGRTVSFQGVRMELSPGREGELPPCDAGALLLDTLSEGYAVNFGTAGDYLCTQIQGPDGVTLRLWRTQDDVPVYAELGRGEDTELILRLSEWEIKE